MQSLAVRQHDEIQTAQPITGATFNSFISYVNRTPETIATYTRALRQLFQYMNANGISRPTTLDIINFEKGLAAAGRKPTTIRNYLAAARVFFKWAEREGIYPNIMDRYEAGADAKPDKEHKRDCFSGDNIAAIMEKIDRSSLQGMRDYALIALLTAASLRTVEASRANVEDLRTKADGTVIHVQGKGKSDKGDFVKLDDETANIVREYLSARGAQEGEPLFSSLSNRGSGARLATKSIREIVKRCFRAAGYNDKRLTAHSLRHTGITLSLLDGKSPQEVQQYARHASFNTTLIYSHALDKAKNSCSSSVASAIYRR